MGAGVGAGVACDGMEDFAIVGGIVEIDGEGEGAIVGPMLVGA